MRAGGLALCRAHIMECTLSTHLACRATPFHSAPLLTWLAGRPFVIGTFFVVVSKHTIHMHAADGQLGLFSLLPSG